MNELEHFNIPKFMKNLGIDVELGEEKQRQLLAEYRKTKDKAILDRLQMSFIKLIISRVNEKRKSVISKTYDINVYISEGWKGVAKGLENFDLNSKNKLSTYITTCIDGYLLNFYNNVVSPSSQVYREFKAKVNAITKDYQNKNFKNPSELEVYEIYNSQAEEKIDFHRFRELLEDKVQITSITSKDDNEEEKDRTEFMDLNNVTSPEEYSFGAIDKSRLFKLLSILDEKELFVIKHNFGIDCEEISLQKIGELLNITKQRTAQIKDKALYKMHKYNLEI